MIDVLRQKEKVKKFLEQLKINLTLACNHQDLCDKMASAA